MNSEQSSSICEEQVYEQVYNELVVGLFQFIYYKCGDKALAEDIAQESFLKLWENCSKVERQKVKGFLFTVARNTFLNKVTRNKVKLKFEHTLYEKKETENPEFLMEQKEFQEKLDAAINQLPEVQREVFLLNRIDKLKYREIAELLGISQKAVEKRMHRALIALRAIHKNI